jgi:site-specific DNA-adenine methylase
MDNGGKGKLIAFGWYGGKYSHLNWLLPLLPKTTHFCEPFGGSAAVLINREHAPAIEVIQRYDSEETLFYCDPPYVHDSRGDSNAYAHEMTNNDHRRLADTLHSIKGKVALSGYGGDMMDELYRDWTRIEAPVKMCHSKKTPRQEILWVNYRIEEMTEYESLIERFRPEG